MSDCILWTDRITAQGYGDDHHDLAHRLAWIEANGHIPSGHVIHHRCEVKHCVNVEHLECLTHAQHNALHLNAASWYEQQRSKTHCPQGHEYTPENTKVKRGRRHCRECVRAYNREYHLRNRERLLPIMRERARGYREAARS